MADRREIPAPAVTGDRTAFAHALLECSPDCLKVLDASGNILFFNQNGLCAMEIDDIAQVAGQYWPTFWPAEISPLAQRAVSDALSGAVGSFQGFCPTAKGTPKWWDVVVTAVPNPGGGAERLIVVSRDISARHAEEARTAALAAELGHRINNTLTVVTAIAAQTRRATSDVDSFFHAFTSRLNAMAQATTALVAGDWEGADLRTLADMQLRSFGAGDRPRITLDGPRVKVRSEAAQALALAVNELATNAIKYGALSNNTGHVTLSWTLPPASDALRIIWRETGGPAVTAPARTGLGWALITNGIHGADVQLAFEPEGVVCTITLPT